MATAGRLTTAYSTSAPRQAGQTERTRIEANRDALLAESRERTTEAVAPWAAGSLIAFAIAAVLIAWSKRPHRPVPQHVLMLAAPELAQRPGARLEVVDGEWNVVDDARRELVPVGRRLTG